MSDTNEKSQGGFHIGNVGGSVNTNVGGDMVGRDKITTTTTTIQKGFASEQKKQEFQEQIDQLREALRTMKTDIEKSAALDQDKKDQITSEILQKLNALKEVKDETAVVPAGKAPPAQVAAKVEGALERTGGIVQKLQDVATKGSELAETVGKFAVKYGPLILSARHLFGLP
jgi:predicted phage gp36 major capsid-like protein